MPGLSSKEIARLVPHVEAQGVNVLRTKKGLLLRLPDGATTMVHFTSSDTRARYKIRAALHRSGVTMPTDRQEALNLASYITDTKPTARSRERALSTIRKLGVKQITTTQLMNAGGAPNMVQAAQVLYAIGWLPSRTTRGAKRYWFAPPEADPEPSWLAPVASLPAPEPEPETAPEPESSPAPEPETQEEEEPAPGESPAPEPPIPSPAPAPEPGASPGPEPAGLSLPPAPPGAWSVPWDNLPGEWTVDQVRLMLLAMGVEGELRLWREM